MTCTSCGAELQPTSKFCPKCGTRVELQAEARCPHCGAPLKADAKFCTTCGQAVSAPPATSIAEGDAGQMEAPAQTRPWWFTTLVPLVGSLAVIGILFLLFYPRSNPEPGTATSEMGMPASEAGTQGGADMAAMTALSHQIDSLRSVVKTNPKDTNALLHLAAYFEIAGKFAEAGDYYRALLEATPDNTNARVRLANAYLHSGEQQKAMEELKKAEHDYRVLLATTPENVEVRMALAEVYFTSNEREKAIEELQTVLQQRPDYDYAMYNLGVIYAAMNQMDQAVEWWHKVIATNASSDLAHRARESLQMIQEK